MRRLAAAAGAAALAGTATTAGYLGLVTGRLTLDLGIGRRTRRLGPLEVDIAAPLAVVFAVAAAPYAVRRPRAMREKVAILERTEHMVLAAHRTPDRIARAQPHPGPRTTPCVYTNHDALLSRRVDGPKRAPHRSRCR